MKKYLLQLIVAIIMLSAACNSNENSHQLKIKVELLEALEPEDKVFITGNHPYLGLWNPAVVPLDQINNTTWESVFLFPRDTLLEFKFTKGDWNLEALDMDGNVPSNHRINLEKDTTLNFTINKWKDQIELGPGTVTGNIEVIEKFEATGIKDRDITIWLPPDYQNNNGKRYPVMYAHDGQNVFDKRKAGYNMEWKLDETSDSLISNEIVKPFIIVAIDNDGANRSDEYSDSELGLRYRNFLINELKPFIDSSFRTLTDAKNTLTLGSSMGGLVSFILAWENPDVFGKAACFSPAFVYQKFNYVDNVENYNGNKKDIELYIDNGGVGLEKELQAGIDKMMAILDSKSYDYQWHYFESDEHNENYWAERAWIAIEHFFAID